jgi:hypothetical protein
MPDLVSSYLASADYDEETSTMTITFKNGASFAYANVPKATFEALIASPSHGSFFHRQIRSQFVGSPE